MTAAGLLNGTGTIPLSTRAAALAHELRSSLPTLTSIEAGRWTVRVQRGSDSLWAIVCAGSSAGGLAIRLAHCPGGLDAIRWLGRAASFAWRVEGPLGTYDVSLGVDAEPPMLHWAVDFTPTVDTLIDHLPRDVYPLGADNDPSTAVGEVMAAQRGLNVAVCYFALKEPAFGTALYLADLTALNPFFTATNTKPDGAVGGQWPELGYLPPTPPQGPDDSTGPLAAGTTVRIADSLLVLDDALHEQPDDSALAFIRMLAIAFRHLGLPETEVRDWPARAERTLRDLMTEPDATVRHYRHTFIRPYLDAEYPDVMAQSSLVSSMHDYARWTGQPIPFAEELASGLPRFHDKDLNTLRRYLPNVGTDKDADAVDSWYLYHPLLGLGRMAQDGDARAAELVDSTIDFAISAARHFTYAWPVQFNVRDFSVIQGPRNDDGLGQTDVGGIYAAVMLQAFDRTGEERFLREATAAIDASIGMRFELNYQANLTAWGAAACAGLWNRTGRDAYLRHSHSYLASLFHNTEIWESEIAHAIHFRNFLGATCLHDAPYMAMLECFDSFAALQEYLREAGRAIDPSAKLLITQYCKYALDRAWFYYPDALPAEAIATEIRNGRIDRGLSLPLEDLYADGQPAGQVGQEIYGAGAAFVFASRAFHLIDPAPFTLFCDHRLEGLAALSPTEIVLTACGVDPYPATLSLLRRARRRLPSARVCVDGGELSPVTTAAGRVDYLIPVEKRVTVSWGP